jgi:DNA-binding LacI/PurR family transcriptional regulator
MAVTIHDVARLAGVNPSTVSRVMSGKATVTEETREKIREAMRQLDYHPNSVARSLASGLSGAIGVVVDAQDAEAFSNVYFSRSLFAIEQVAQSRGYNVIIANSARKTGGASSIEALMLERKVDGLILPPSTVKPSLLKKIGDFPYVVLGQPDVSSHGASWVDVNNEQGAALAVEHLREMGYRRVAYAGGDGKTGFVKRRVIGYLGALQSGEAPMIFPTDGTASDGERVSREAMAAIQPPDAFLCNDNLTAFGVLKALKSLNLDVPGRVGLVAFDNYPLAEYTDPPLTAVNVDTALLGEQTARLLFQRIKRPSGNQQIMLSTALIERESSHRM